MYTDASIKLRRAVEDESDACARCGGASSPTGQTCRKSVARFAWRTTEARHTASITRCDPQHRTTAPPKIHPDSQVCFLGGLAQASVTWWQRNKEPRPNPNEGVESPDHRTRRFDFGQRRHQKTARDGHQPVLDTNPNQSARHPTSPAANLAKFRLARNYSSPTRCRFGSCNDSPRYQ